MLSRLFELFRNPKREVRHLNRDAVAIVDMARGTYREKLLRDIAELTRTGIDQLTELCGDDAESLARELERYKVLHREARRHNNQVALTAYTLVIIHARSLPYGDAGAPARDAIEQFVSEWPGEGGNEGTLAG